jgi:hypothetical protein
MPYLLVDWVVLYDWVDTFFIVVIVGASAFIVAEYTAYIPLRYPYRNLLLCADRDPCPY